MCEHQSLVVTGEGLKVEHAHLSLAGQHQRTLCLFSWSFPFIPGCEMLALSCQFCESLPLEGIAREKRERAVGDVQAFRFSGESIPCPKRGAGAHEPEPFGLR